MLQLEERLIARGGSAANLMESAGAGIASAIMQFCPHPGQAIVYAGKGNNAGDGLVAARYLLEAGWQVSLRLAHRRDEMSQLALRQLVELGDRIMTNAPSYDNLHGPVVIIDALLGLGARPGLQSPYLELSREIRQLRGSCHSRVFALDIPTGLDADSGAVDAEAVVADYTLTIGLPKCGLFSDEAVAVTGRLALIQLEGIMDAHEEVFGLDETSFFLSTADLLRGLLPRRENNSHKGNHGRLGIIAGSPGFIGAAVLTTECALRSGAGLVEVFAAPEIYDILARCCPPEAMVKKSPNLADAVLQARLDAVAIGPGIGRDHDGGARKVIAEFPGPCVIDADAITVVAEQPEILKRCRGQRLLTPHQGEMGRLTKVEGIPRWQIASDFAAKFQVTLILKGARTLIAEQGMPICANPTGSPALAAGGTGDCLTGICAGLLAQAVQPYPAACIAAWLHGRAAEYAMAEFGESEESLVAGDIPRSLGRAFCGLKQMDY